MKIQSSINRICHKRFLMTNLILAETVKKKWSLLNLNWQDLTQIHLLRKNLCKVDTQSKLIQSKIVLCHPKSLKLRNNHRIRISYMLSKRRRLGLIKLKSNKRFSHFVDNQLSVLNSKERYSRDHNPLLDKEW